MTKEQKASLSNETHIGVLPYTFKDAMLNHCNYNYRVNEKIDDVLSVPIGKLGKFWKFIDNIQYLNFSTETELVIKQSKGQNFGCLVPLLKGVESVTAVFKDKSEKHKTDISIFKSVTVCAIDFSFDNPIKKLILNFNYGLAEPLEINFEIEYYKEPEIDNKKIYLEKMNVSHSTGNDLVNIYFQPCCEEYERTEITLFKDNQMLAKYKVEDGVFFKSIGGLAYGTYEYIVKQYGKNDNLILESEKIKFSIDIPNYGGKPTIYW